MHAESTTAASLQHLTTAQRGIGHCTLFIWFGHHSTFAEDSFHRSCEIPDNIWHALQDAVLREDGLEKLVGVAGAMEPDLRLQVHAGTVSAINKAASSCRITEQSTL